MKKVINFNISKGEKYYIAQSADVPVVTQGQTLDELAENINEAVALYLEDENAADYGLDAHPAVVANVELPSLAYVAT